MPQTYCPEGCYWPCEHRNAEAVGEPDSAPPPVRRGSDRWTLGPGTADDPEQAALDEWLLASVTGVRPSRMPLQVCIDCGRTFRDAIAHARTHEVSRQLEA